ncbi:MAG: hypothetical protein ACLVIQ_05365 [Parabacteroides distasonis]
MLYGDQHRYNILGELSRTGYLNEKKRFEWNVFNRYNWISLQKLKVEGIISYDAKKVVGYGVCWKHVKMVMRTGRYATFNRMKAYMALIVAFYGTLCRAIA